jgi:hypothetical protein
VRSAIDGIDDAGLAQARQPVALARLGAQDCGSQAPKLWQSSWVSVGRFVVRYLDRESAPLFWGKLVPPRCRERLDSDGQHWYRLLNAVASRDPDAMIVHASELLGHATPETPEGDTFYVAAALMLGHLARQQPDQAHEVFAKLPQRLPPNRAPSLELRWLEAIAGSRLQRK